jgi:flagellar motor switch protein FliG
LGHLGTGQRFERSIIEEAEQPITLRFEDLILLDDRSLAQVFHVVDSQVMLLALAGATVDFIKRVSGPLTSSQKERFNEQIQTLGPISLSEIEQAQQNVAETATRLANAGQITITGQQPFLAAA